MKFTKKFKENMINTTKIKSYIGFAIRMRKATFGVEGIKTSRRKIYIVLYDESLAANSIKKLTDFCLNHNISCRLVNFSLSELTKRVNVKAVAIEDSSLAQAIAECMEVQHE